MVREKRKCWYLRSYFYSKEGGWYNNESEKFARLVKEAGVVIE